MTAIEIADDTIAIANAPALPGLVFRHFRGEADYLGMLAALIGSKRADGLEAGDSLEQLANNYAHLTHCDTRTDMVIVEAGDAVVGYTRLFWTEEYDGTRAYQHVAFLLPEWRRKGIGRALLRHNERRVRTIAAGHPAGPRWLQTFVSEGEAGKQALFEQEGYTPVRYFFEMVRPNLDDIPDAPLPPGLEVRPVKPEHLRAIWAADVEAFRDHWGAGAVTEADYRRWLGGTEYQPEAWKVAWDVASDQVAGMVLGFIDAGLNVQLGRQRGWTENISVRRPWRKKGVARALIAENLRELKARGMTEAALGVDADNPTGALRVYESIGFRTTKRNAMYRKPLN